MRLTSKSAVGLLAVLTLLLIVLAELRAHNRLHLGAGDAEGDVLVAKVSRATDPIDARIAALEAKIDGIAAEHTRQIDEMSFKLSSSLLHVTGMVTHLKSFTDNYYKRAGGDSAPGAAMEEAADATTKPRPLPNEYNGKFDPKCCSFEAVKERIDRIQNSSCFTEGPKKPVYFFLTSHGFGVDIMGNIANIVWQRALHRGLPFWITDKHWHYAKGVCEDESLGCYFKHVGAQCKADVMPYEWGESSEGLCCSKERLQYFAYEYITQPLPKYQALSTKRAAPLATPPDEPCAALHVRRGDSLLNMGYNHSRGAVYRNVSVKEYIDTAKPWLDHFKIKHILLMSDDADAVIESRAFPRYQWHHLDRKRFTSEKGVGWENHFPSGSRETEIVDILALRQATRECSLLIGSQSQFGITIWKGMMANKDSPFVYVETRARNLLYKDDDPRQTTRFGAPPFAANVNGRTPEEWAAAPEHKIYHKWN